MVNGFNGNLCSGFETDIKRGAGLIKGVNLLEENLATGVFTNRLGVMEVTTIGVIFEVS